MKRRQGTRPDPCRALVTGGSGAIGGAICLALARQGMHVIVHAGQGTDRADAIVDQIRSQGGIAERIQFDLADGQAIDRALEGLLAHEPLPVLVHNAGRHDDAPLAGMSATQWHSVIDINLNAFYHLAQPTLMSMARLRWGRIVAISSVAARLGNRGQANYAAAKAGLHGAVRSISREMAGRGITANVVAPGLIETGMSEQLHDPARVAELVPAGRLGQAEDVAALVEFLCADAASYINAQLIGIDGGMAPG